jgi:hypothetical protein
MIVEMTGKGSARRGFQGLTTLQLFTHPLPSFVQSFQARTFSLISCPNPDVWFSIIPSVTGVSGFVDSNTGWGFSERPSGEVFGTEEEEEEEKPVRTREVACAKAGE